MSVGDSVDPYAIFDAFGLQPLALEVAEGGADTSIWHVFTTGDEFALRVFREGEERRAVLEREAMLAAAAAGVPVPAVRGELSWQGRAVLLLEWCAGSTLMDVIAMSPGTLPALARSFGRLQRQLNSVAAPRAIVEARDWIDWAGPAERALEERLRAVALEPPMLLHMDYHPYNVLVHGGEACAVLDWANVRGGDPRADYARTLTLLRLAPLPPGRVSAQAAGLRRELLRGWKAGYGPVGGEADMPLFLAWAGAAMMQDLEPKLGKERLWMQPHHLDPIRRWTAWWKRRGGIA